MERGDQLGEPTPVWPEMLIQPVKPPLLAYLDLNHWIGLAKYRTNHRDGARYQPLFEACVAARQAGNYSFVLSQSLLAEVSNILDPRQRNDIASVIDELTNFEYLLGRPQIMRHEIQAIVNSKAEKPSNRLPACRLIDFGALHAFGFDPDFTKSAREAAGIQGTDPVAKAARRWAERMILAGPADEELPDLEANGYSLRATQDIAENRAEQERDQAKAFDAAATNWRRGRIRDVIAAREVVIELAEAVSGELSARGMNLEQVLGPTRDDARAFALGMPSTFVSIELKTRYHRDPNKKWVVNDIHDIDALSVAVPYCDLVFTDGAATNAITAAHLDRTLGTQIPKRINDAVALLSAGSSTA